MRGKRRIIAKVGNEKIALTSSTYYELTPSQTYVFVYTRRSYVLVDVKLGE